MADVHVIGLKELNEFLQTLPVRLEKNVLRGGLRAGMNMVKPVAQRNIHNVSSELAKGLKVGTEARGGLVTATLKATGKHRSIAHLVEFGTAAHNIMAKFGGMLSFLNVFRKDVRHPGARAKPFMRPALDATAGVAVVAVGEYIKNRLETKHGLDTAHVMVEGDE
jgi:hypothetical protein